MVGGAPEDQRENHADHNKVQIMHCNKIEFREVFFNILPLGVTFDSAVERFDFGEESKRSHFDD